MNDIRQLMDILENINSEEPVEGDILELELGDVLVETTISEVLEDGVVISVNEDILSIMIDCKKQLNERMVMGASTDAASSGTVGESHYDDDEYNPVMDAILRRIMVTRVDLLQQYGIERITDIARDVAEFVGDVDEIGSGDVSIFVKRVEDQLKNSIDEAKYQGREVPLGKPMAGDVAKSKVYVRGPKGNVVKVNFGDKNMRIKKSNPARRKSFRARHNCDNPGPRWKARYWSCKMW